jgi:hypothetical protein
MWQKWIQKRKDYMRKSFSSAMDLTGPRFSSRPFLYAQCRMLLYGSPMPKDTDGIGHLRKMLRDQIAKGVRQLPMPLLTLERQAIQQYDGMLARLQSIIAQTSFQDCMQSPPRKKYKRSAYIDVFKLEFLLKLRNAL